MNDDLVNVLADRAEEAGVLEALSRELARRRGLSVGSVIDHRRGVGSNITSKGIHEVFDAAIESGSVVKIEIEVNGDMRYSIDARRTFDTWEGTR